MGWMGNPECVRDSFASIASTLFFFPSLTPSPSFLPPSLLYRLDPFLKKEWYDIKAPSMFSVKQVGKTLVTRSAGTKIASDALKGRIFECSLADLNQVRAMAKQTRHSRVFGFFFPTFSNSAWGKSTRERKKIGGKTQLSGEQLPGVRCNLAMRCPSHLLQWMASLRSLVRRPFGSFLDGEKLVCRRATPSNLQETDQETTFPPRKNFFFV